MKLFRIPILFLENNNKYDHYSQKKEKVKVTHVNEIKNKSLNIIILLLKVRYVKGF